MDPAGEFLRALARARGRARFLALVESLPLAASAVAAGAALALAIGLPAFSSASAALLVFLVALLRAPVSPRRLDGRLSLGGGIACAAEVARRGPSGGIERLLLLEATRALPGLLPLPPRQPGAVPRVFAIVAASLLASLGASAPIHRDPVVEAGRIPSDAIVIVRVEGSGTEEASAARGTTGERSKGTPDGAEPPQSIPTRGEEVAGAGRTPGPRGGGSGRRPSEQGEKPEPGERTPKPVPIEPEAGPRRSREAFVYEFEGEAGARGSPRRQPLRDAAPRAKERATGALRRSLATPAEAAFAGRYFERIAP